MFFSSEYVLAVEDSDEEDFKNDYPSGADGSQNFKGESFENAYGDYDGDDYDGGFEVNIMGFDEEEEPMDTTQTIPMPGRSKKVASNTVKFDFKSMIQEPADKTLPSSERVQCSCGAVLSHIDIPIIEDYEALWECQFCEKKQEIKVWPKFGEEGQDILYMDDTPSLGLDKKPLILEKIPPKDAIIIFVIDISGSMNLPVKAKANAKMEPQTPQLKMDELSPVLKDIIQADQRKAESNKNRSGQNRAIMDPNLSNITRMQTVKAGLIEQLQKMPDGQRVGLITFNHEVTVYGDFKSHPYIIPGHKSDSMPYEEFTKIGDKQETPKPIKETRKAMVDKIKDLEEDGHTALGPALTVAMAMAKRAKGSKIIVCTDGVANYGIGGNRCSGIQRNDFYNGVTERCREDGISISIVSFGDCDMGDRIGSIPNETGGLVERVISPNGKFQEALERDLNDLTYAINVNIRFSVNKNMFVSDPSLSTEKKSMMNECLGNITLMKQHWYAFGFQKKKTEEQPRPEQKPFGSDADKNQTDTNQQRTSPEKTRTEECDLSSNQSHDPKNMQGKAFKEELEALPVSDFDNKGKESDQNGLDKKVMKDGAEAVMSPFQFEVTFTTMTGERGTRVWTSLKPVTTSLQKAEESAHPNVLVTILLQGLAKEILQMNEFIRHCANKNQLVTTCHEAFNKTEDQKSKCGHNKELLAKLNKFSELLCKIIDGRKLDDNTSAELRQWENGQF